MKISNRSKKRKSGTTKLEYGKCEPRKLMAAGIFYDAAADIISIYGTGANDTATVQKQSNGYLHVSAKDHSSTNNRWFNQPVREIKFHGNSGDDFFRNYTSITTMASGGLGNDTLVGGNGADRIYGGYGNDKIWGLAGDDSIHGNEGNDTIYAGSGNDYVTGYFGNDEIWGQAGNDTVYAGSGNDFVQGGSGNDEIYGGSDNDRLYGSVGDDLLDGQWGDDIVAGWTGNDRVYGGNGNDSVYGQDGNDSLRGGTGSDRLYSGNGYDRFLDHSSGEAWDKSSSNDVQLKFYNSGSQWTYKEISQMDEAFEQLVDRTGTNILLRDSLTDDSLKFYKASSSEPWAGLNSLKTTKTWNFWGFRYDYTYDRKIFIAEYNENNEAESDYAISTMIHEIAHNWDSTKELNVINGGRHSKDFYAQSKWTLKFISNSNHLKQNGYRDSGDKKWLFNSTDDKFARNYGKHNPFEDWATMWEEYFDRRRNPRFELTGTPLQPKLNILDAFFSNASRYA